MENIFKSLESIKANGFEGFKSISYLSENLSEIPNVMGVYMILRNSDLSPKFLTKGTGGFFKNLDPNVAVNILENNWVTKTKVLYIGKAGAASSSPTLRSRLNQYFKFGRGGKVGHRGGRYIWQLEDAQDLLVCWIKITPSDSIEPRDFEYNLIQNFKNVYNMHPFANLQD